MPLMLDSPGPSTPEKEKPPTSPSNMQEYRRTEHHEADVVIVGAGIAGSAAAVAFGRQGRSVILLERSLKEPDRIVGELLQPGGVRALEKLGLRDCLDGIDSIPNKGYEVFYHGRTVHIPYALATDPNTGRKERPEGRCFHHGRFIRKLREAAMREPNVTVVETTATELVKDGWTGQVLGVECTTKGYKDFVSYLAIARCNAQLLCSG
jgi:squalene monooxygenase